MLRNIIFFLFFISLPGHALAQQKVPILIYHSINEYKGLGSKELFVTPENFEKQMLYLKNKGYTLLTFERWNDIGKYNKPIFITFDDGYKNNQHAFEILQKLKDNQFKPSATFFVISDFIGLSNRLSQSELKVMAASGIISVQSHTATHPDLTKSDNLQYELKGSKEKIERITGKPVIALAYPYGNVNDRVTSEVKKYYSFGLTTTPELFTKKGLKYELFYLPRVYVKYSTTLEEFAAMVK
ncbi:polysaccharide deacetylase family protein [Neobacillus niacini]|uniref:polysaccharide deacetylase family protein n=1 Tax=Neobacillus niacini TaxID=86668 RepID=UPI0007ABA690|nr:polysaccharide deacetylase family protein [Neobacillus niacini]MEC1525085.1 polysaccharide deacetylase family protein [Neobacillus niacini]